MRDRSDVDRIKQILSDPREVCERLGLARGAKRLGRSALMVLCPWHDERTPSCHVQHKASVIVAYCHGCHHGGDVLDLVAAVLRLDREREFAAVLQHAADLARVDLGSGTRPSSWSPPPAAPPPPPKTLPPTKAVRALWSTCVPVSTDPEVTAWLRGRGLDPEAIDRYGLARALPEGIELPRWATYRGGRQAPVPWSELGYRLLLPMVDASGTLRSVRVRAVIPGEADAPKALPASGYTSKGVVMADPLASMMLALGAWPEHAERRVVITEGEPDFLTWASRGVGQRTLAVLGLGGSGQWTEAIAARIPDGSTVILRTDPDDAGDRYAEEIAASLLNRCKVLESDPEGRRARRAARAAREAEKATRQPGENLTFPVYGLGGKSR